MEINGISSYIPTAGSYTAAKKTTAATQTTTDGFEKTPAATTDAGTYTADVAKTSGKATAEAMASKLEKNDETSKTYDKDTVTGLINQSNQKINEFRKMLDTLLKTQAKENGGKENASQLSVDEDGMVHFSPEAVKEAGLSEFDENGYWGSEQTAQRIFGMAIAFSGGDEKTLQSMKDAISKGFEEVENLFGGKGKLPEVSYKTKDRIAEMFEEYENGGKTADKEETEVNAD